MKTKNVFFITIVALFGVVSESSGQASSAGTTPLNTISTSDYLGSSNNFDVVFRRNVVLSGRIGLNNTSFGLNSLLNPVDNPSAPGGSGIHNCAFGVFALQNVTTGNFNVAMGYQALSSASNITGNNNVGIGYQALRTNFTGSNNVAIGTAALSTINTSSGIGDNVAIGGAAGALNSIGVNNVYIGSQAGLNNLGSGNVFIGSLAGSIDTGSNRLYIHNSNSAFPLIYGEFNNRNLTLNVSQNSSSRATITSGVPFVANSMGTSGLRFTNLRSGNAVNMNTSANRVLSVDVNGDVILVNDIGGGVTNNCLQNNFVTKTNGLTGNLTCSQIFDNGTSVGIGTTTNFGYVSGTTPGTVFQNGSGGIGTGTFKLDVVGATRSLAFWAYSDKKFKKDIQPINSALSTIEAIDGKTYLWNREANRDMNFDNNSHSGFIAQELEKVLPHIVATDEKGNKAVNYMELMPYLVEAIKEQQTQIKEQQNQIVELNNRIQDLVGKDIIDENKITDGKTYFSSNYPNPFETTTKIDYFIDANIKEAKVIVYDANGSTISNYDLKERATPATFSINKGTLKTGVYFYTLITDGNVIGTKKMIVK